VSNDYIDNTQNRVFDGRRAAASDVNNVLDAVTAAFDQLPSAPAVWADTASVGTAGGTANAIIVTLVGGGNVPIPYVDGQSVVFRATADNTGPCTLALNDGSPKALVSHGGEPLEPSDLVVDRWYGARFNTSTDQWQISSDLARSALDTAVQRAEDAQAAAETAQGLSETALADAQQVLVDTEAVYDSFDDRYLGAKAVAPTQDNDGDPLLTGAVYFNTDTNVLYVWDGSDWLDFGAQSRIVRTTETVFFTPKTTFTVPEYTEGYEQVYFEGIKQVRGTDYNCTNSTTITFTSAVGPGVFEFEAFVVLAFSGFVTELAGKVEKAGDTMTGGLEISADVPFVKFVDENGPADEKKWLVSVGAGDFEITYRNDAESISGTAYEIVRDGSSIDSHIFYTGFSEAFEVQESNVIAHPDTFRVGDTQGGVVFYDSTGDAFKIGQKNGVLAISADTSPQDGALDSDGNFTDVKFMEFVASTGAVDFISDVSIQNTSPSLSFVDTSGFGGRNDFQITVDNDDLIITGGETGTENVHLRINSDFERVHLYGDVGIGTDGAQTRARLHVEDSSTDIVYVASTGANADIKFNDIGSTISIYNRGIGCVGDDMRITTAGLERLRVTDEGLIGLSKPSPTAQLHMQSNQILGTLGGTPGDDVPHITLEGRSANADYLNFKLVRESAGANWQTAQHRIQRQVDTVQKGFIGFGGDTTAAVTFGDDNTEFMRIDMYGNVGIGTDAPTRPLDVEGVVLATGNIITDNDTSSDSRFMIQRGSTEVAAFGVRSYNNDALEIRGPTGVGTGSEVAAYYDAVDGWDFRTDNTPRMRITDSGQVLIGATTPKTNMANSSVLISNGSVGSTVNAAADDLVIERNSVAGITILSDRANSSQVYFGDQDSPDQGRVIYNNSNNSMSFATSGNESLFISSDGEVGIGENTPLAKLHVKTGDSGLALVGTGADDLFIESDSNAGMTIASSTGNCYINFADAADANVGQIEYRHDVDIMSFAVADDEKMRITSGGNLLLNTLTATAYTSLDQLVIGSTSDDFNGIVLQTNGTGQSAIAFTDGSISSRILYNHASDSMTFRVAGDDHMFIDSLGNLLVGQNSASFINDGISLRASNTFYATKSDGAVGVINRLGTDGILLNFYNDSTAAGNISVSGTTVSYNGAHLSRWSQLPEGESKKTIKRGTVMSSVDEMCEWFELEDVPEDQLPEDQKVIKEIEKRDKRVAKRLKADGSKRPNEQLTRCKVSDVVGDKTVSGVFQGWDEETDYLEDDFYVAQTGDFVIRVTGPCNVGDLLESNGDGTAKVQADDIIRSSTIAKCTKGFPDAKMTEENIVPCLLMLC